MRKQTEPIKDCTAVVFCGGRAARIRSILRGLPKALVPIAGRPYLVCLLTKLKSIGFTRCVLCISPFALDIKRRLRSTRELGLEIRFSKDSGIVENAGALWCAMGFIDTNTILCLNGDTIVDVDYHALIQEHMKRKPIVSLVASSRSDQPHPEGVVLSSALWVKDIVEEELDRAESTFRKNRLRYMSNSGVYVINRDRLSKNWPVRFRTGKLETGLFRYLARKHCVWAFDNGYRYLLDFGSPDRLKKLRRDMDRIEKLFMS
ncbi:NTP transferase domain-containing protein [Candidatus Gottesmanbacteria bacterium]|nr:NTP transferase domain-containing protein [Candidatus Gottesmanbacteria bacterium]